MSTNRHRSDDTRPNAGEAPRRTATIHCHALDVDVEVVTDYVGHRGGADHYVVRLDARQTRALFAGAASLTLDAFPPGTAVHLDDAVSTGRGAERAAERGAGSPL